MLDFFANSQFAFSAVLMLAVIAAMMTTVAYSIYFERKIAAWIQDRRGPNRVGFFGLFGNFHFWGLGQPIADGLKFLLKEDIIPARVDRPVYLLAPVMVFLVAMIGFAVIPWGGSVDLNGDGTVDVVAQVANPDIGLLYLLGVGAMGVYGVFLGGWASNNKYSMFGAVRAASQMLSYEVPMGLAILVVVLATGQLRLEGIVLAQVGSGNCWNVLVHPLAFGVLLITQFAETNRTPFDLAEAEQELVGGFHTEYSSMKFALFFLAEYTHIITNSAFIVVLFLGGWHLPFVPGLQPEDVSIGAMVFKMAVLGLKIVGVIFFYMWVRWTIPRFRFDQLMRLAWKGLVPVSMGLAGVATMMVYWGIPNRGTAVKVLVGLAGNLFVLGVVVVVLTLTRGKVSGRQANLPQISMLAPAKPKPGRTMEAAS
ncbi:MAG: NADH-quinone oxidoreductase subunit NuoH [Planctomycetes bacterium]|nr:NADH-quinone oxidoreductase subunit NuoH [Planctomycetota bacterium]